MCKKVYSSLYDPLKQAPPSGDADEKRSRIIITLVITAIAITTLSLFGNCLRAIHCGGRPQSLLKLHAFIWGAVGIPMGMLALINLLALPTPLESVE